jgi:hypothetical protein
MEVRVPTVPAPALPAVSLTPLPRSLVGLKLGVLDNHKPNASIVLAQIVADLGGKNPIRADKSAPLPAPPEALTHLAKADLIIVGNAD